MRLDNAIQFEEAGTLWSLDHFLLKAARILKMRKTGIDIAKTQNTNPQFRKVASTCFRIGSKFRCIGSTSTAMQSISENDLECLASTGVNAPLMAKKRTA